jgi:hypothetical protein
MVTIRPLRRAPLAALALAALAGCAQIADAGRAALSLAPGRAMPETAALTAPLVPAKRPAAPLARSFAARDLITGRDLAFDVRRSGDRVTVRQSDGCVWSRQADWFAPSSSWENCDLGQWATGRAEIRRTALIWPLREGAQGGFTRKATSSTGRSYARDTACRVTGAEAVVRESGKRTPTWVVQCRDGKRTRTTWWSPEEGPVAFRKAHADNGVEEAWVRL